MTDVPDVEDLFHGPALVVDDDPDSMMSSIGTQIRAKHIPVIVENEIPDIEEVRNWSGLSFIILDWQMHSGEGVPAGVIVGGEAANEEIIDLVKAILDALYCPIFIFSNQDSKAIHDELSSGLGDDTDKIDSRILIKKKEELAGELFQDVGMWIKGKPALYVLKCFDHEYERTRTQLFKDLQDTSMDWPHAIWETAESDSINPSFALANTVTQNILHRMSPLDFDEEILKTDHEKPDAKELHRIIHREVVIDNRNLPNGMIMPGDFFCEPQEDGTDGNAHPTLYINITPACDSVPRSGGEGEPSDGPDRLIVLEARPISTRPKQSKRKKEAAKYRDCLTEDILYGLTEDGVPYKCLFKLWTVWDGEKYTEMSACRKGRLIEPYITRLQQKFALFLQRQGLPRFPDDFYSDE